MQKLLFLSLLLPVWTFAQTLHTIQSSPEVYPDSAWDRITNPGDYGWDINKLSQFRKFIIDSAHTTGMMVIQNGKALFEFGDVQELSYLASCRKSVLSMLYGPFVENRTID